MSLDSLEPFQGAHAIQNAVFSIEWKEGLSDKEFKGLKTEIQTHLQLFKVFQPMKTMVFNMTGEAPAHALSEDGGFVVEIPGGFAEPPRRVIQISKEGCIVVINDYSRWQTVKPEVLEYLRRLLGSIKTRKLSAVSLQYTDLFIWKADPDRLKLREIFRDGTPFLAPKVLDLSAMWHCNFGFFEPMEDTELPDRLNNVNVSRGLHGDHHAFNITTSHRLVLTKWFETRNLELIETINERFHEANKSILKNLLTSEVCTKINLV